MYALNISESHRIIEVMDAEHAPAEWIRVETIPEGDITDFLYMNDEYIFEPFEPLTNRVEQNEADTAFIAMMTDIEL